MPSTVPGEQGVQWSAVVAVDMVITGDNGGGGGLTANVVVILVVVVIVVSGGCTRWLVDDVVMSLWW